MKVSTENDNNFGYEKITIVVDNLRYKIFIFQIIGPNMGILISITWCRKVTTIFTVIAVKNDFQISQTRFFIFHVIPNLARP
jgi:hypothetical protein